MEEISDESFDLGRVVPDRLALRLVYLPAFSVNSSVPGWHCCEMVACGGSHAAADNSCCFLLPLSLLERFSSATDGRKQIVADSVDAAEREHDICCTMGSGHCSGARHESAAKYRSRHRAF
jgi:hypothetical protein